MLSGIIEQFDFFIPKKVFDEESPDKLWLSRCFIGITLFISFNLFITIIVESFGVFYSEYYSKTTLLLLLSTLFLFKVTGSLFISINVFCLVGFVSLGVDIITHGQLFSEPLFLLIVVPIAAFVFYDIRVGFFWIGIIYVFLIFLFLESKGTIDFLPDTTPYNDPNYSFILQVVFVFETLGLLYIISKSKSLLINQLDENRKELDINTNQLRSQTNKLLLKTKELEQLKTKLIVRNDNLTHYAATTAHDLKQPVRTMTSFASLLQYELGVNQSERVKEYLSFIISGGKQMTNQVDKVLDIANMSKEIVFCPIDTKEVVNNTIQMLDSQIKQANAKVYINELPNQIIANEVSIIKVFQNLISNGIKFNDKDQIKIEISGEETPSEWLFKIKDNGNGIDHSFQDQIFHFGEQVIPGNKGNGIGLNTCSKLVKLHMGKIWMNSTLGKGSEFIFSINKNLNPV